MLAGCPAAARLLVAMGVEKAGRRAIPSTRSIRDATGFTDYGISLAPPLRTERLSRETCADALHAGYPYVFYYRYFTVVKRQNCYFTFFPGLTYG